MFFSKGATILLTLGISALSLAGNHTHNDQGTAADGDHAQGGMGNSIDRQCAKMQKLEHVIDLVNNQTKFDAFQKKHNLTQVEVDRLKNETAQDQTMLKTLQANATLVQECAVVEANQMLKRQCHEMAALTELVALSKNNTALQEFEAKHNKSAAWVAAFMERAANASTKLSKLQSNTTLVNACQKAANSTSCKSPIHNSDSVTTFWPQDVKLASNSTVHDHFNQRNESFANSKRSFIWQQEQQ